MDRTEFTVLERDVEIPADGGLLYGSLAVPEGAHGLVLFAHGSGSSRWSPRNRRVAAALQAAGLATLLFDLLSEREEAVDRYTAYYRFDVDMLARRLARQARSVAARVIATTLPYTTG